MAKKEFNLGDSLAGILGNVSNPDAEEQITYIPLQNLVSDERNFYSMDGVDELAANIELIGLQQPLRVLAGENGFYVIVSGHRRAAALRLLAEEAPEKWARVPCIVEKPGASPELEELRLIMANADTRRMSSADMAKQAERVEMLLYKLKEQGMEFPGRMRDHVAEACKISRTKLATMKAIKNNLIPELYARYEKNELNESAAYELQKLPREAQLAIADSCARGGSADFITSVNAEYCVQNAERFMTPCKCGDGDDCDHHIPRFVQALRSQYSWARCDGQCCLSCSELYNRCKHPCAKAAAKRNQKKSDEAREQADLKEKSRQEDAARQAKFRTSRREQAQRVLPLIEKAGLSVTATMPGNYSYSRIKISDVKNAARGDFGDAHFYDGQLLPTSVDGLKEWADELGCSLDYLAGRTPDPTPWTPAWISVDDHYPDEGQYVFAYTRDLVAIPSVYFRAAFMDCEERSVANNRLTGIEYWSPRPQLPAGKKWPGQEIIEEQVKK